VRFKAIACARQCTTWWSSQPKPQPLLKLHTNFRAALQFDGCCSAFNASNTAPLSSDDTHACRVRVAHGGAPAVVNRCYAPHHIPSLAHYMITSLHGQLPKPMSWDGFHGCRAAVNTATRRHGRRTRPRPLPGWQGEQQCVPQQTTAHCRTCASRKCVRRVIASSASCNARSTPAVAWSSTSLVNRW
jgi:hypothetical protein